MNAYDRPEGGKYSLNQPDVRKQLIESIGGRLAQAALDYQTFSTQYAVPPPPPKPAQGRMDYASVAFERDKIGLLVQDAYKKGKELFAIAGVDHSATPGDLRPALLNMVRKLHPDKLEQLEKRQPTLREQEQFGAAKELLDLIKNNQLDAYRQALGPLLQFPVPKPAPKARAPTAPANDQDRAYETPFQEMMTLLRNDYQTIWKGVISQLEARGKIGSALKTNESKLRVDPTVRVAFMMAIEDRLNTNTRPEGGKYSLNQTDVREYLRTEVSGRLGQVAIDYINPPQQTPSPAAYQAHNAKGFDPRKPVGPEERAFMDAVRKEGRQPKQDRKGPTDVASDSGGSPKP
ncbi:MAG: hypothetical protein P1U36_05490 [Legionellaceae bacterium]|nr:hypothetical protein [Legionellaceae bacterium]